MKLDETVTVTCPLLCNPTLRRCLVSYATSEDVCEGCQIGSERALQLGPQAVQRLVDQTDQTTVPTDGTHGKEEARRGSHALLATLYAGPTTTRLLRRMVRASVGHSRGVSRQLETLRQLGLVSVRNHGDLQRRETWTWLGFSAPLGRFKSPSGYSDGLPF